MDVVLLSDDGEPIGRAPKAEVHTDDTPLHLAFSCHLSDGSGRVLVTRRALGKRTWPGVWTNSFCGHPQPGEDPAASVVRHARTELGAELTELRLVLPRFRYRAVDASGIVENELCPVYTATLVGELSPAPDEVVEWRWLTPDELDRAVATAPFAFSPWLVKQLPALAALRTLETS